jgi:hypothetical protein
VSYGKCERVDRIADFDLFEQPGCVVAERRGVIEISMNVVFEIPAAPSLDGRSDSHGSDYDRA